MTESELPFQRIKVRVAAAVFMNDTVALVRRTNAMGVDHYSLPGGNVGPGEPLLEALARELMEELGLRLEEARSGPDLTWLIDAMVSRPGNTPPRKLHLVFRLHIDPELQNRLHTHEIDDTGGEGEIVWTDFRKTGKLNLFPRVPLAKLAHPTETSDAGSVLLPPMTDDTYHWI